MVVGIPGKPYKHWDLSLYTFLNYSIFAHCFGTQRSHYRFGTDMWVTMVYVSQSHRIHGTGIFTYSYHQNRPNVRQNTLTSHESCGSQKFLIHGIRIRMTCVLVNRKLSFKLQMWVICHGKIKKGFVLFCGNEMNQFLLTCQLLSFRRKSRIANSMLFCTVYI